MTGRFSAGSSSKASTAGIELRRSPSDFGARLLLPGHWSTQKEQGESHKIGCIAWVSIVKSRKPTNCYGKRAAKSSSGPFITPDIGCTVYSLSLLGAVFCGIGQAGWEYQVTVEYSLPPLYSTTNLTLNGTGSFTDPGSGSPILTIDLGSATINYLRVIFGSFNGISLSTPDPRVKSRAVGTSQRFQPLRLGP